MQPLSRVLFLLYFPCSGGKYLRLKFSTAQEVVLNPSSRIVCPKTEPHSGFVPVLPYGGAFLTNFIFWLPVNQLIFFPIYWWIVWLIKWQKMPIRISQNNVLFHLTLKMWKYSICSTVKKEEKTANSRIWEAGTSKYLATLLDKGLNH